MIINKDLLKVNDEIQISLSNVYKEINKSVLYDKRIEEIRKYFDKKYNIDRISLVVLSNQNKLIHNLFYTNEWADYNWKSYKKGLELNIFHHPLWKYTIESLFTIEKKLNPHPLETKIIDGLLGDNRGITLFSSIIGKKIFNYTAIVHNEKSNTRVWFGFGFKNQETLNNITYETYYNLMADFNNFVDILDNFVDYYNEYDTIEDSSILESKLKNDKYNFINN
jgi:hypothetical protein